MSRWEHPVQAKDLFATAELQLRYPKERELRREGFDEGQGHGFDEIDTSALAIRVIASRDSAPLVIEWFVERLGSLGWSHRGDGVLVRDKDESILLRIDRDRGASRVAASARTTEAFHQIDDFERSYYGRAAKGTIITISFGVAL